MTSVYLKSAEPLVVYKLLWRGMSRGVGHFLAFRAMGKDRIWATLLTVKDALCALVRPCVEFSFGGGGNAP